MSHLYEGIYHIPQCGEFSRCICKNWLTTMCPRMVSWDLGVQAEQEIFSCNLYYLNFNMYLYHLSKRFLPVFFLFINNLYPRNFATISIPMKGLRVSIFLESSRMWILDPTRLYPLRHRYRHTQSLINTPEYICGLLCMP